MSEYYRREILDTLQKIERNTRNLTNFIDEPDDISNLPIAKLTKPYEAADGVILQGARVSHAITELWDVGKEYEVNFEGQKFGFRINWTGTDKIHKTPVAIGFLVEK